MPRKTKEDLRQERMIQELERLAFDPDQSSSARARYMGTLNSLNRQRAKQKADKQAAARARKAAQPVFFHSVLPENHRGPVKPAASVPAPVSSEWLPRPGESAAQTRARLEKMAGEAD
jgi:hypothetical protein